MVAAMLNIASFKRIIAGLWRTLFASVFLTIFGYGAAQAGKPAALALEVSGATTPVVEAFTELETKNTITLDASTTIEFLHYASCKTVIVQGGQLSFTEQRYLYKGGKVLGSKRAECPKSVAASGASQIGGVVMRSAGGGGVRVTTRPSFVLVGARADEFSSIRISQGDRTIHETALDGRTFHYPDSASTLEKGQSYEVTLTPKDGAKPRKFKLKAQGRPKKDALTLIRVD